MAGQTTNNTGENVARVVAVKGELFLIKPDGQAHRLQPDDPVQLGDTLKTSVDGAAVVAVADGHAISIGHSETVVFDSEFVSYCRLQYIDNEIGQPAKFDTIGQAVRFGANLNEVRGSGSVGDVDNISSSIQVSVNQDPIDRINRPLQLVFEEFLTEQRPYTYISTDNRNRMNLVFPEFLTEHSVHPSIALVVDRLPPRLPEEDDDEDAPPVDRQATAAPTVTITEDANNDGFINAAELSGNVDVRVTLPADAAAGDTLNVSDGTTTITQVLTAADITAGAVLVNFAPPAEGSTITVTATVTDTNGNVSPSATDNAKRDTVAPSAPTVSITEDHNNDGRINNTELKGTVGVTITLPPDAAVGDVLKVFDGTTTQTITLTAAQVASGSIPFEFTPPAEGSTLTVTATLTDPAGNTSPSGSDSALRDTTATAAPTVSITEDANNDGKINGTELVGNVDISVGLPATAVAGDVLTVTDGNTTQTVTLTAGDIGAGTVAVQFTPPAQGGTITVNATVTDAAGNTSPSGSDSAVRDTVAPLALTVTITEDTNNDGRISSTELVGDVDVMISLPTNAVAGDVLTVSNGTTTKTITLTATQVASGNLVTQFTPPADGSAITVTASVADSAGNVSPTASDTATRDTTKPPAPVVTITEDANNDGTISAGELSGNVDVSVTVPAGAAVGDVMTITASGTTQQVTLVAADLVAGVITTSFTPPALGDTLSVSATLTDAAGNVSPTSTDSALRPTGGLPVPGVTITEDANNDGRISTSELSGNVDAKISIPAGAVVGDTISVTDGTTTTVITLTATDITAGFVTTNFTPPANGSSITVTATWTQISSGTTSAPGSDSATRDTTAPPTPTVTITEDANNDGRISTGELSGEMNVSVGIPAGAVVGDVLRVSDGRTTHVITLTNADIVSGTVAVSFTPPSDGASVTVTATITDTAGNVSGTGTDNAVRDTTATSAPGVFIAEDANNDGTISAAELSGNVDVVVSLPATAVAGDVLTVTDGITPQNITLTAAQVTAGSVTVQFAPPAQGGTISVSATVTDQAGNVSPTATDSAVRDTAAPSAPTVTITEDTNNDGSIAPAELSGNMDVSIALPVSAVAGDVLTVSNGSSTQVFTLTAAQIGAGVVTTSFTPPPAGNSVTVVATVRDAAGNTSPQGSDTALRSTTASAAPTVTITEDTNNDGRISSTELSGNAGVSVGLPVTAVAGDVLRVTDGSTVQTFTLTAAQVLAGTVLTEFSPPAEGGTLTVTATVTDSLGNVSAAGFDSAVRDTSATAAPVVTILEDGNNDGKISATELSGLVDVRVSVPTGAVAGDTLTIVNGAVTQTVILSESQIATGFIVTAFVPPAEGGSMTVTATLTDAAGNVSAPGSDTAQRDTSASLAPTVVITEDANNDALISNSELSGNVDVAVTLPGTAVAGDTLIVTDGTTPQSVVLTAADISSGTVNVQFLPPPEGSRIVVTATITDAAGNVSPAGTDGAVRDNTSTAPVVTIIEDINNDAVISSTELSGNVDVRINLPANAVAGDKLTVSDGSTTQVITLTASQVATGSVDTSFAPPVDGSTMTVTAFVTDAGGNNSSTGSDSALRPVTATIAATTAAAVENGSATLVYTVSLSNPSTSPVTVNYSVSGTATEGSDYPTIVTKSITIAAGSTTGTIVVDPSSDTLFEGNETLIVTLTGGTSNGNAITIGGANSATGTITDSDAAPTISSVTSPTVTEGTDLVYTVSLSNASASATTFAATLGGGASTASAGDFTALASATFSNGVTFSGGNFTVPAGVTSFTVTVPTTNDTVDEPNETVELTVGGTTGTGTITDDDAAPTVSSVSSNNNTEGSAVVHTVTLSNASSVSTTYAISLTDGTALGGTDYSTTLTNASFNNGVTISGGTITVPAGVTSFTVSVATTSDTVDEANETYTLTVGGTSGTGTINDDDGAPTISSVTSPTVTEGTDLVYTVSLSNASASATTFAATLGGGASTASAGDFTALASATFSNGVTFSGGNFTVPAGVTSFTVTVPTTNDTVDEPNETVELTVGGTTGTGTITDDDAAPTVSSVSSNNNTEGSAVVHTVTLSNASSVSTTYAISLTDGTALGGTDYSTTLTNASFNNGVTISGGTITVPAGVTSFTVSVATTSDTVDEANETYTLTVGGTSGTGTINDDDGAPTISSVTSPTVTEGTDLVYTVSLSNASASATTFAATLGGGASTASAGDFTALASATFSNGVTFSGGNFTVPAGVTSFTVTVPTTNDTVDEPNETVELTVGGTTGTGTITDDDAAPTVSSVSSNNNTEGSAVVHTVTLSNASSVSTTYAISLTDGTALGGTDYSTTLTNASFNNGVTISGGTITVPAGVTSFTVSVATTSDTVDEANETYTLTVGGTSGTGTINDDDGAPTISSVTSPTVTEGTDLVYTVSLSNASASATTFAATLGGGASTASAGDFTALASATFSNGVTFSGGNFTVPAGVTSFTVTVPTTNDTVDEPNETVELTVGGTTGTGTITDDDAAPTVSSVSSNNNTEGSAVVHTVTLSNASSVSTTYAISLTDGTALGGTDYSTTLTNASFNNGVTISGGTITVPAGVTSFTVSVATTSDTVDEANETYTLTVGGTSGTGTINDDDGAPTISSVTSPTVTEGTDLVYTVSLSNASASATTFAATLGGGASTASAGDFTALASATFSNGVTFSGGNFTVPAGVTSFTVTVPTTNDTVDEPNETVELTVGGTTGTGTITDDDAAPTVSSVSSNNNTEGSAVVHTVTLSNASSVSTTYAISLTDGTALGGTDYSTTLTNASFNNGVTISGGTITVPAGVTSFTVSVATTSDTVDEANETYTLTVGGTSGTGTINDDDGAPTISSVTSPTVTEGTDLVYTVSLSNASASATTFAATLGGGASTASAGDFTALASATFSNGVTFSGGNFTVPAGVTSFTVTVPTTNDTVDEPNETVELTVGGTTGTGTITDDDAAPTVSSVSSNNNTEGSAVVHTVTLSNASSVSTTYAISLTDGTALGGTDYSTTLTNASFNNGVTISGGTITVPAGVTSFTVSVATTSDTVDEANETYTLTVGGTSGTGTINDDDGAPTISSVTSPTVTEGTDLVYTVSLSNASASATTFAATLGGGASTASAGDFTALASATFSNGVTFSGGNFTVPAGVTSFTVTVPTTNDTVDEPNETVELTVGGTTGTGTITDDDAAPTVSSVSSNNNTEGLNVVHTVTLSNASSVSTTYAISLTDGTALGGTDYSTTLTNASFNNGVTISGGTITVPAGVTSFTVSVATTSDTVDEANETYTLTVGGTSGTGTITDDDGAPTISSVTSPTVTEGTDLVYTVSLSNASASATTFAATLGGGASTASAGDFTALASATFSNGVTFSGGNFTVPAGVTSFTVTVPTTSDTVDEPNETVELTVGGTTGTGTITDDDAAPTVSSVSSNNNTEGSAVVHTVTLSNASSVSTTYAISLTDGTALGGTDYSTTLTNASFNNGVTISGGTITVPAGVTSFTVSVATTADTIDEANETYTLTVGGTSGTGTINDDDSTPSISSVNNATVNENTSTATTVLDVNATDADGDTLTYSISGGVDAARFNIDSNTGVITFAASPDFENPLDTGTNNVYNLTVTVTDGSNPVTQNITITVQNVNEAPAITSNGGGATASVNVVENSTAVTTVTATDPDSGDTKTYSITGGADAAFFSIDASTGALVFKAAPDFETPADSGGNNVYDVTVRVTDSGGLTDDQAIAVTVTNQANELPVVYAAGTKTYVENATPLAFLNSVGITDVDSTTLNSVVVTVTNYDAGQDVFAWSTLGTSVAVSATPSGGNYVITLSGGTSISEYLSVLQSMTYANSSNNPTVLTRAVTIDAYDQTLTTQFGSNTGLINITPVNDAPTVTNNTLAVLSGTSDANLAIASPLDSETPSGSLIYTVASLPGAIGTVTLSNGTAVTVGQVLTLAQLTSLQFDSLAVGTSTFTYTVSDGVLSTIGTTTIRVGNTTSDTGTVYESALSAGSHVDVGGTVTAAGNVLTNDAIGPTAITSIVYKSVSYTDASDGSTDGFITLSSAIVDYGSIVFDITGAGAGSYTYTLDTAPNVAGTFVNEVFTYNFTAPVAGSDTLTIRIEDDEPTAISQDEQIPESNPLIFDLYFMVDTSGSMTQAGSLVVDVDGDGVYDAGVDKNRMDVAKEAFIRLAEEYFEQSSDIRITVSRFSSAASTLGTYTTIADVTAAINTLTANGGTNYEVALNEMKAQITGDLPAMNPSTQIISYFMSDGDITSGAGAGGLEAATGWQAYMVANSITSYGVGIGANITDSAGLDYIHNVDSYGKGGVWEDPAMVVTDPAFLEEQLLSTVPTSFGGSILSDGSVTNVQFGADGGYVSQITMYFDAHGVFGAGNEVITYNGTTVTLPAALVGTAVISGSTVTLDANDGFNKGKFTFDFSDGSYTFFASNGTDGQQFDIDYVVVDAEGDSASATATVVIVDAPPEANDDLHTLHKVEIAEGNVISGVGTDAGVRLGTGFTPFAPQGSGIDNPIDNADITAITYKGQSFNLDFYASAPAGGSSGSLTWVYALESVTTTVDLRTVGAVNTSDITLGGSGSVGYTNNGGQDGAGITSVSASVTVDTRTAANVTASAITLGGSSTVVYENNGGADGAGIAPTAPDIVVDTDSAASVAASDIRLTGSAAVNYTGGTGAGINGGGGNDQINAGETMTVNFMTAGNLPNGVKDVTLDFNGTGGNDGLTITAYATDLTTVLFTQTNANTGDTTINLTALSPQQGIGMVTVTGTGGGGSNVNLRDVTYTPFEAQVNNTERMDINFMTKGLLPGGVQNITIDFDDANDTAGGDPITINVYATDTTTLLGTINVTDQEDGTLNIPAGTYPAVGLVTVTGGANSNLQIRGVTYDALDPAQINNGERFDIDFVTKGNLPDGVRDVVINFDDENDTGTTDAIIVRVYNTSNVQVGADIVIADQEDANLTLSGATYGDIGYVKVFGGVGSNLYVRDVTYSESDAAVSQVTVTDSSDGSSLIFRSNGYYKYTPTNYAFGTASGGAVNVLTTTAGNVAASNIRLTATNAAGSSVAVAYDNTATPIGAGVTGGLQNDEINVNEILTIDFLAAGVLTGGVQAVSLLMNDDDQANSGNNDYIVRIYDIFGKLLTTYGVEDLNAAGATITIPVTYNAIGAISLEASNPNADMKLRQVTYTANTVLPAVANGQTPVDVTYTLTDSDNQSDQGILSLYTIDARQAGTSGNDTLSGSAVNDGITGGDGDDTLTGNAGNDSLGGEDGNDTLYGNAGLDNLNGGDGDDTLYGGADNDQLYGGAGTDVLQGDAGDDVLDGGAGNDTLYGNDGDDVLYGRGGDDTLDGGLGNDTLQGANGDNILYGREGNDILSADTGLNLFYGGLGNDTLTGGVQKDTFIWQVGDGGTVGTPANDTITNFSMTDQDVLSLSSLLLGEDKSDVPDLLNYLNFTDNGTDTTLTIDVNGDTGGGFQNVQTIVLQGVTVSDLSAGGTTTQDVINHLLTNNQLILD